MNAALLKSASFVPVPPTPVMPVGLRAFDESVKVCQVDVAQHGGKPAVHFGSIQPLNVGGVGFLLIRGRSDMIVNLNRVLSIRPMTAARAVVFQPAPVMESIQKTVADYFGIDLEVFLSRCREERIAWPRQIAMYLCRRGDAITLLEIGRAFGGRDHGTVLHAIRTVKDRMASDGNARHHVLTLQSLVMGPEGFDANQLQLPLLTPVT